MLNTPRITRGEYTNSTLTSMYVPTAWKWGSLLFLMVALAGSLPAESFFRLTASRHTATNQLDHIVVSMFGPNAQVADWDAIKTAIGKDAGILAWFYNAIGLMDQDAAMCTAGGASFFGRTKHHYYLKRWENGPPPTWVVHDSIGTLYLGAESSIIMPVLAATDENTPFINYAMTHGTHSESQKLASVVRAYFGTQASLADWENLKTDLGGKPIRLQNLYATIGLIDQGTAICRRNGQSFWGTSNRQYYLQRFDNGPYKGFQVHDQVDTLYLGSWYGIDMNVLAYREVSTNAIPNAPPVIVSRIPIEGNPQIGEATSRLFSVQATDAHGGTLSYQWQLNGHPVGGDTSSQLFTTEWGDAGSHTLTCRVTDGIWPHMVSTTWQITVLDDNDGDGLPNAYENTWPFLDPWDPSDASEDFDGDFLDHLGEFRAGTKPTNPDSDFDGIPDGWEVRYGLSPTQAPDPITDLDIQPLGTWNAPSYDYSLQDLAILNTGIVSMAGSYEDYSDPHSFPTGILFTVDVRDPGRPHTLANTLLPDEVGTLEVLDGYAYASDVYLGLISVDCRQPAQPELVGRIDTTSGPRGLATGSLYGADSGRLVVYNTSHPTQPYEQYAATTLHDSLDLTVCEQFIYVGEALHDGPFGYTEGAIECFERRSHAPPLSRGAVTVAVQGIRHLDCYSNVVFGAAAYDDAIVIVDCTDPDNPVERGRLSISCQALAVHGNYLYAVGYEGLFVYDITDPIQPLQVYHAWLYGNAIRLQDATIYLGNRFGLDILENRGLLDSDNDGLLDRWEQQWFHHLDQDAGTDFDGDGLPDGGEFQLNTDPTNPDHDGDGLRDGDEVRQYNSHPALPDSDGDGIEDGEEVLPGEDGFVTRPDHPDTDGDGADDFMEVDLQRDPTSDLDAGAPAQLAGRVLGAGSPLAGAVVEMSGASGRIYHATPTDGEGRYRVVHLQPGTYYLVARATFFADEWYENAPHRQNADPMVVEAEELIIGLDFMLDAGQSPALLEVSSEPQGAAIYLDHLPTAQVTPATINMGEVGIPASHPRWITDPFRTVTLRQVTVAKDGYIRPVPSSIYPVEAGTVPIHFDLTDMPAGSVEILTQPPGTEVYIDYSDQLVGLTPIVLPVESGVSHSRRLGSQPYRLGSHSYHLSSHSYHLSSHSYRLTSHPHRLFLRKKGYLTPQPIAFDVQEGSTNRIEVTMRSMTNSWFGAMVFSLPPTADVYVDYQPTRQVTDVTIGGLDPASHGGNRWFSVSHTITLRKPGYLPSAPRFVDVVNDPWPHQRILWVNLMEDESGFVDLDGDGLPDGWEDAYDLDRAAPGESGADDDPDHDGHSNNEERFLGTNPLDADSRFKLETPAALNPGDSVLVFTFDTIPGRMYVVQASDQLESGWGNVSAPVLAETYVTSVTLVLNPEELRRYFRASQLTP